MLVASLELGVSKDKQVLSVEWWSIVLLAQIYDFRTAKTRRLLRTSSSEVMKSIPND